MNRRVIRWTNIAFGALLIVVGIASLLNTALLPHSLKGQSEFRKRKLYYAPVYSSIFSSRDLLIALQVSQRHAEQNFKHFMLSSMDMIHDLERFSVAVLAL